jgi:hypothetical protein
MTNPIHVTRSQAKRLERNLKGEKKAKPAKTESVTAVQRYSMSCIKCISGRALVIDTHPDGQTITRTRRCESCGYEFKTIEYALKDKVHEGHN